MLKEKLAREAVERANRHLHSVLQSRDTLALGEAKRAQDKAFNAYLSAIRESGIHRAVRSYSEAR